MRIKIKEARQAAGLKQHEAAAHAGVSQPYFAQIERGVRPLKTNMQVRIADVLGVKPADLVDFDAPTQDDEALLLEAFRSLSSDRRAGWLDMARATLHPRGGADGQT